jgi:hypothetical protein
MHDFLTDIVDAMADVLTRFRLCQLPETEVDCQLDGLYAEAYRQLEPYFPADFPVAQREDLLCRVLGRRLEEWLVTRVPARLH